jgi:F-type H+-transporting ATPase subunit b
MIEIFRDPEFWVLVSFVIAVGGLVWKASPILTRSLDARAAKIKAELDEAQRLREDAQRTLAEYQRKQRDALKEAEQIIAHARTEAKRAAQQAARDLDAALERRQRLAMEKIALAESKATAEVRNTAVDVAVAAVRQMLTQQLDAPRKSKLIDDAIAGLPERLH